MKKITWVAVAGLALAGVVAWWVQRPTAPAGAGVAGGGSGLDRPASAGTATSPPAAGGGRPAAGAGTAGPQGAGGGAGPSGPVAVEVSRAVAETIVDDVQAVGSLRARQGVVLRPEVSGRIARLGFSDGQAVRRGQLLVQLDDTLQQAQLEQARAQASIARTNLARSRDLLAQNFVSASAVDQNAANLQVAEAQVALAQAQLARMRILAPFDGMAGLRAVDVGDYVKDGAEIVNLQDLGSLEVEFALPERYVGRTKPGLPVEVRFDALPGREFGGRIVALNSLVDANGRSLTVRARVENPGAVLKPGMFARPRVVFAVREGAVTVPEEALVPLGSRQFLFKVVDGPDGRKLARRLEARIGTRMPGRVELLDGVSAGEQVVTAGQARLRGDAVPVRVVELGARPGPAARPASGAAPATPVNGGPASRPGVGRPPAA